MNVIKERIKEFSDWLGKVQFLHWLLIIFAILTTSFLFYHEKHLPIWIAIILVTFCLAFSLFVFYGLIWLIHFLFSQNEVAWYWDASVILVSAGVLYLTGFLENRAGVLFFVIYLGTLAFTRIVQTRVYFLIALSGLAVLSSGLLIFQTLQKEELLAAYVMFGGEYQQADPGEWDVDEAKRLYTNTSLGLSFHLPEAFYFHQPDSLDLTQQTGIGRIAGIISTSDKDPNRYPSLRIFFIPESTVNIEKLRQDFFQFLDLQAKRGDIKEIHELGKQELKGGIPGIFFTFYDVLRPRYAKTGFYTWPQPQGYTLILQITENLEKGKFHEDPIERMLEDLLKGHP